VSFEKEFGVTALFFALILMFVSAVLYYKLEYTKQHVKFLELEMKELRGSVDETN